MSALSLSMRAALDDAFFRFFGFAACGGAAASLEHQVRFIQAMFLN